jgi:8-oxo-dGTP diphosphatase
MNNFDNIHKDIYEYFDAIGEKFTKREIKLMSINNNLHTYDYPMFSVTVDIIFEHPNNPNEILLIKRAENPFKDFWALPGGHCEIGETVQVAAKRELLEETGINCKELDFKFYVDDPDRDPSGRKVSFIFSNILCNNNDDISKIKASSDAKELKWFNIHELPEMAFDHRKILERIYVI